MESRLPHTDVVELIRHLAASPAVEHSPDIQTELVQWSRLLRRTTRLAGRTQAAFVPTHLQVRILKALAGRALRTDPLAKEVGIDNSQIFRSGGLHELRSFGLVKHNKAVGFYRPDAPPPDFSLAKVTDKK